MPNIIPLPNMQFQAPSWERPFDSSHLGASIDNLFTAYQRGQLSRAQLQGQQLQNQAAQQGLAQGAANFQMSNMGLTPQDITQNMGAALRPAPTQASFYTPQPQPAAPIGAMQSQASMQVMPQMPQMPQSQQPQEDPKVSVLRNIMQMHLQGAQLGMAGQIAGIEQKQGEAANQMAQANKENMMVQLVNGETGGGLIQNVVDAVKNRQMSPEQLNLMGRTEFGNMVRLIAINRLAKEGININQLQNENEAQAAGMKSSAALTQGGSSQQVARATQSAFNQFGKLQSISDEVGRYNNRLLNQPFLKIASTTTPGAARLMATLAAARIEYARAASGSTAPSDVFMAEAAKALPDSITPQQLPGVIEALKDSLTGIGQGQMTPATLESVKAAQTKSAKWSGGTTHTYPNGVKAQWNGSNWMRMQ